MQPSVRTKIIVAAVFGAIVAGLQAAGQGPLAQQVTVIGSVLLGALGLNAVGQGLANR